MELDPNSVNRLYHAVVMYHTGQRERAIADVLELIDREPNFALHYIWLSAFHARSGDLEKAAAILERAQSASVQYNQPRLALFKARVLALQAKTKEAREILAQVGKSPGSNALRALVLHSLGEDREALDLLENVVREGQLLNDFLYLVPSWSKLHGDPRFRAILKSLNLDQYVPIPASTTSPLSTKP
jgi:tetratricopeptide (TPR) repeat protein